MAKQLKLDTLIEGVKADASLVALMGDCTLLDCMSRAYVTKDQKAHDLLDAEATRRGLIGDWEYVDAKDTAVCMLAEAIEVDADFEVVHGYGVNADLLFIQENAELAQALQAELGMGKPLSREERVAELDRWIEANRLANGMHDWHVVEWCHHIATQCRARFGAFL